MKELRHESKATVTKRRQRAFQTEATEAKGRSQRDPLGVTSYIRAG